MEEKAKVKNFYLGTLVFFSVIIGLFFSYYSFGSNDISILRPFVRNFSYVKLAVVFIPVFLFGALWILTHLNLPLEIKEELDVKGDILLAWYFPRDAVIFNYKVLGMIPADWFFLVVNVPLGFIAWCIFDVRNPILPMYINGPLMYVWVIVLTFIFAVLAFYVSYSCRISHRLYVLPLFGVWLLIGDNVCFVKLNGLMAFYTAFILFWDYLGKFTKAWLYHRGNVFSLLFNKDKRTWFKGTPFGIAFAYGWESWFFTALFFIIIDIKFKQWGLW